MNRYVLVYMSMIDHLRKGLLSPNELVVLVSLVLAAGWSEGRADYARVERNVHRLHRELFFDQETGNQVWTRQGLDKIVKSLVAKGYVVDEGKWWYLPSYRKWQMEVPKAFKTQRTSAKEAQEKATPVANSLVEGTQEKATPVAIEGPEEQPPLLPVATPVAKKATPVAKKATPVAPDRPESGVTSESPAPSYMTHTSNNHTTPLPPQGEEAGAAEEEKLLSELEEYFTQQLQVPHLGHSDFRHIRSFIERKIPLALIKQVVADAKRGYRPKFPGDRIKHVGFFVREIETRLATPSSPAPTGVASAPSLTAEDVARDERLSRKLEDLRKELRTALTLRRSESDPRFIAALRGIQQKASNNDLPWPLIVAGTDLEGSVA